MAIRVRVRIEGIREVLAAFDRLPAEAQQIVRDRSMALAEDLADRIRAAGTALGPQDALAARTVRARRDRVPVIQAGASGGRKARGVIFGSEFGMNRRSGWYADRRFRHSAGRQFRPPQGASSYRFFR